MQITKQKVILGINIVLVVFLILGSLQNVIGYETIQYSYQNTIKNDLNQKELVFQTIIDLSKNKAIQQLFTSHQTWKGYFNYIRLMPPNPTIPTKNQLEIAYHLGLILSTLINKSEISTILKPQVFTSNEKKNIIRIIENDTKLSEEFAQLSVLNCHCQEGKSRMLRPVCAIIFCIFIYESLIVGTLIKIDPSGKLIRLDSFFVNLWWDTLTLWVYTCET